MTDDAAFGPEVVGFSRTDLEHVLRCVELAAGSDGLTQPHPKSGCVLVAPGGVTRVGEGFQMGQGGRRAEVIAVDQAAGAATNGVAYLNLEPVHGVTAGEDGPVAALIASGVASVVIGVLHPVPGIRGRAVAALREAGIAVHVLSESSKKTAGDSASVSASESSAHAAAIAVMETARGAPRSDATVTLLIGAAAMACRKVNRALLYRCATGRPFSVFKYAMTLDGKIATTSGHASWVTGPPARGEVWAERARSDAVIVGGRTVRRDNPNLTTRKEGGHHPIRIVLSRSMDLPGVDEVNCGLGTGDECDDTATSEAKASTQKTNLWDTTVAPTIVMTEKGRRPGFQAQLRGLGVEVIEFDELTPDAVSEYCATRGFMQLFWECGGGLGAPALRDGVIHHVMAFVAPKIIGTAGGEAPTPVGEMGHEKMTEAIQLRGLKLSQHGKDILISGYVPPTCTTGFLREVMSDEESDPWDEDPLASVEAAVAAASEHDPGTTHEMRFYKSWDKYGGLSNFSPHPIDMPRVWGASREVGAGTAGAADTVEWPTVEHFYQAQKFSGVDNQVAAEALERIRTAGSPESAARVGRTLQRTSPELIRADWNIVKEDVMRNALRAKLTRHNLVRELLLSSRTGAGAMEVLEDSPCDPVWGVGRDGKGGNLLGKLLMELRDELADADR